MLKKMTVFVTGAESGIGRDITLRLLDEGCSVIACHHLPIEDLTSYISRTKPGSKLITQQLDVTDNSQIKNAVSVAKMEEIDVLINVAGIAYFGDPLSTTDQQWQHTMDVNVNGYFNLTRELLPLLTSKPGAIIINMSSIWGEKGSSNMYAYSVSKHAVEGLTKGLREYCKPFELKVTSLVLDKIDTNFRSLMDSHVNISEEQKKLMLKPSDVSDAVIYVLATSETALVTSITLDAHLWK